MSAVRKVEIGTPYNPYKTDRLVALIPDWLMERPEITSGAKLCYSRLRQHAGKDGQCWPRTDTLARETGVSERSVIRHTQELEKFNLIRSIRRGQGRSNKYIFLTHIWMYQNQEPPEPEVEPESDPAEELPQDRTEPDQGAEVSQDDQGPKNQPGQPVTTRSDTLSPPTFKRLREKKTTAEPVAAVPSVEQIDQVADLIPEGVNVTEGLRRIIRKNIARHGTDYVRRNVLYTNAHIRNKGKYRAYLDKCLRGDWGIDFTKPEELPAPVREEPEIVRKLAEAEREAEKRRVEGRRLAEAFLELPEAEQERIRVEFFHNANAFTRKRTERLDNGQLARNISFQGFLAVK